MKAIRQIKLELLRQGPKHNQLLSPLTPYIALCGSKEPQTVHIPYEHRQLLLRLGRLRYELGSSQAAETQRDGELRELGESIGGILGQISGLQSAVERTSDNNGELLHLRLSASALELSMVPFEAAIAPLNFPGSGSPMQLRTPVVITREARRAEKANVQWARQPRILFAFATPAGMRPVPAQAHLNALRNSIEPYVKIKDTPEERLESVKQLLTVIPEASLKAITDACRSGNYTHVHILAHGAPVTQGGQDAYGVALRKDGTDEADVVVGQRLAEALCCSDPYGTATSPPTLVSLATCDSGTVENVITPGGSIAHALHEEGIPWVIASQFPLWMRASTIAVDCLYSGILSGTDPRYILYQLRQRLRAEVPETHDWASIVAYAETPWDFEKQIATFHDRQRRKRLEVLFDRLDALTSQYDGEENPNFPVFASKEFEIHAKAIREIHQAWINGIKPLEKSSSASSAEAFGMSGASEKRLAIYYEMQNNPDASKQANEAYKNAQRYYRQAIAKDPTNHWVITQFLALSAIPQLNTRKASSSALAKNYGSWWQAARTIAEWKTQGAEGQELAWAWGTIAELELLGCIYQTPPPSAQRKKIEENWEERVSFACKNIIKAVGDQDFAVFSTRRQFDRYKKHWPRAAWSNLVEIALKELGA